MKEIPSMYRKLSATMENLSEYDKKSDEEIARRLRFTKKEVKEAIKEIGRYW